MNYFFKTHRSKFKTQAEKIQKTVYSFCHQITLFLEDKKENKKMNLIFCKLKQAQKT